MRTADCEGALSHPPVRHRADGEVALAGLLRIGSGLGTGASRRHDEWVGELLRCVVYVLAVMLVVVSVGALI